MNRFIVFCALMALPLSGFLSSGAHADKFIGVDLGHLPQESQTVSSWQNPAGTGVPIELTYSYSNLLDGGIIGRTPAQLQADVEESLAVVAEVVPIHFIEVADAGPMPSDVEYGSEATSPNLRFGHHTNVGNGVARAYYPIDHSGTGNLGLAGDVHMGSEEFWNGEGLFLEVFLHELGHALGLGHEDSVVSAPVPSAFNPAPAGGNQLPVMCATCYHQGSGQFDSGAYLYQDDVNGLQSLYGVGVGSVTPIPEPTSLLFTVVMGFASACRSRRRVA